MWLSVAPRNDTTRHVYKGDWTTCLKYDNYSRINNHHNWEGPIWPFMNMRDFTLVSSKMYIMRFENDDGPRFAFANHLVLVACFIPRRSGLIGRCSHVRSIYLSTSFQ